MQALVIEREGAAAQWVLRTFPEPVPGPSELLIRVMAAGLNRADLRFQPSHYGAGNGVAGAEMAGIVIAAGVDCAQFVPGDRVMAMAPGCFAEQIVIDHRLAVHIPEGVSWVQAAALPAAYMTAHDALTRLGEMRPGMNVLVQGATSSVGVAALQLARYLGAERLVGVARSPERLACLSPYLDVGIEAGASWPEQVLAATDGQGVDLVFDLVGGETLAGHLICTAPQAVILAVGRLGGAQAVVDLDRLALRRLTLIGTTFRSRTPEERAEVAQRFAQQILPAIAEERIQPLIDAVYPIADATAARERLAEGRQVGKIILDLS